MLSILTASMLLRTLLAWILFHRKLYRAIPIFTAYVCFNWASTVLLFICQHSGFNSFVFYWYYFDEAISILLDCWMIFEIFRSVMRLYPATRRLGAVILRITFAAMIGAALSVFIFAPAAGTAGLLHDFLVLARSAKLAQLLLVTSLLAFCWTYRIPLPRVSRGISYGIAILAAVNLACYSLFNHFGLPFQNTMNYVLTTNYVAVEALWIYFLWLPDKSFAVDDLAAHHSTAWNAALSELMER